MLRFLHFSDIHFGQEKDELWEPHEDVRQEALADIERVLRDKTIAGPADGILISGDIAQSGKEAEFKHASEWLEQVIKISGCPRHTVKMVPGNHDVDLDMLGAQGIQLQKMLRQQSLGDIGGYLATISAKEDDPIWAKFANYRSFANAYNTDFVSYAQPVAVDHFPLAGGRGIRLIGLCTVCISDRTDEQQQMILGANQYRMTRAPEYEDIYMMHHPVSWLKEADDAQNYLNSRARILITGHEHFPALARIEHDNEFHQAQLAAGATNPPKSEKGYGYTFNWIELAWSGVPDKPVLQVTLYPRKWMSARTRFDADHERLSGKTCRTIELDCEPWADPEASHPEEVSVQVTEAIGGEVESATIDVQDTNMMTGSAKDSGAIEELRYLFWRNLTRQQRVESLIELGLLTEAARVRIPSVVERQAFADAGTTNKFDLLWERTMSYVPEAERSPNPFRNATDAE